MSCHGRQREYGRLSFSSPCCTLHLSLLLLLLGLLLRVPCSTAAPVVPSQYAALQELQEAWGTDFPNWDGSNDECNGGNIEGVECDDDGNIISLQRFDKDISGSLPTAIGELSYLELLDLSSNQLSGAIPTEISYLAFLSTLVLTDNFFSSSIPDVLYSLQGLTFLDLSGNTFTGTLPASVSSLFNLVTLNLRNNQLAGTLTSGIESLTALQILDLRNNFFTSAIPPQIGNLTNLIFLELSGNAFSSSIPDAISNLEALTSLSLRSNQLSGSLPEALGSLSSLVELDISINSIVGSLGSDLAFLVNLESLKLQRNLLSGTIPASFFTLPALTYLDLSYNNLRGFIDLSEPDPEQSTPISIKDLRLNKNFFSGPLESLIRFTALDKLRLQSNYFSGNLPSDVNFVTLSAYLVNRNFFYGTPLIRDTSSSTSSLSAYVVSKNIAYDTPLQREISASAFSLKCIASKAYADLEANCLSAGAACPLTSYPQKNASECSAFCSTPSATVQSQQCNGVGVCVPSVAGSTVGPTPSCRCSANYSAILTNPPTCGLGNQTVICAKNAVYDFLTGRCTCPGGSCECGPSQVTVDDPSLPFQCTCPSYSDYDAVGEECGCQGNLLLQKDSLNRTVCKCRRFQQFDSNERLCKCPLPYALNDTTLECEYATPCPIGRFGLRCEGVCQCRNGGVCKSGKYGDGSCTCPTGLVGKFCDFTCRSNAVYNSTTDSCSCPAGKNCTCSAKSANRATSGRCSCPKYSTYSSSRGRCVCVNNLVMSTSTSSSSVFSCKCNRFATFNAQTKTCKCVSTASLNPVTGLCTPINNCLSAATNKCPVGSRCINLGAARSTCRCITKGFKYNAKTNKCVKA